MKMKLMLLVYNLFDRLNENSVYSSTGRAYSTIIREQDINGHRSNFNDYYDVIKNPAMYAAPRMVRIGLGVEF